MEINAALEIVSYKLGLKLGTEALKDKLLLSSIIKQAIADQSTGEIKKIEARQYMQATKLLKEERLRLNKVAGENFLAENQGKNGFITTDSGLQYRLLIEGSGPQPTPEGSVTVHYEGSLIDGTVFDSSFSRGTPSTFTVKKVIAGWQEALTLMRQGSKMELIIPQHLAYGDRGSSNKIPPFSALLFKIHLIDV